MLNKLKQIWGDFMYKMLNHLFDYQHAENLMEWILLVKYKQASDKRSYMLHFERRERLAGRFLLILVLVLLMPLLIHFGFKEEAKQHTFLIYNLSMVAAVFISATFLFRLRVKNRFLYGLLEVAFSLVATNQITYGFFTRSKFSDWVALVGAIYLVIRGFDNCREAMKAKALPE